MTDSINHAGNSPLGKNSAYVKEYDASLLFPIPRQENRRKLGIEASCLPFTGQDIWNGFELSWLSSLGMPRVAWVTFVIPADSPNIIESKSFKLYLNSFNQSRFDTLDAVQATLVRDLSAAAGRPVIVDIQPVSHRVLEGVSTFNQWVDTQGFVLLDEQDIEIAQYTHDAALLHTGSSFGGDLDGKGANVRKATFAYVSHLLKSNCPVTGQPDWATLFIWGREAVVNETGLLKYIVSYREQQDFHEHCVESIFTDVKAAWSPESLSVYARYTRRGGLDINPFRTTETEQPPYQVLNGKLMRQ